MAKSIKLTLLDFARDAKAGQASWLANAANPKQVEAYIQAIDKCILRSDLDEEVFTFVIAGSPPFQTPQALKEYMLSIPEDTMYPEILNGLQNVYTTYCQILQEDLQLSLDERLIQDATDYAHYLRPDAKTFVEQFVTEHHHLPMFYLLMQYYSLFRKPYVIAMYESIGLFGVKKSLDQLADELHKSKRTIRTKILDHLEFLCCRQLHEPNWEYYFPLFTESPLTMDNIPYETIRDEEQLLISKEDFLYLCNLCLPWSGYNPHRSPRSHARIHNPHRSNP